MSLGVAYWREVEHLTRGLYKPRTAAAAWNLRITRRGRDAPALRHTTALRDHGWCVDDLFDHRRPARTTRRWIDHALDAQRRRTRRVAIIGYYPTVPARPRAGRPQEPVACGHVHRLWMQAQPVPFGPRRRAG